MDIVVDIQCFKNTQNKVVPKEIAIVALNDDFTAHWVVAPKNRISAFSRAMRRENNWLTENHHGLDFFEGDITEKALYRTLRDLTRKVRKIYVRGKQKWTILYEVTAREIINLETDKDCPPFHRLPWVNKYCLQHAIKSPYLAYTCALNNAHRLKNWLSSRDSNRVSDIVFQPPLHLCDGQSTDSENITLLTSACRRSIRSGSNSEGVDETDSICSEH